MAKLFHPTRIAIKLIKALVIFSSVITLITTSIQLWSEYGRDLDAITSHFEQVERGYLDSVAGNVWQLDTWRLQLLLTGILETPDFQYAVVRETNGEILAEAGKDKTGQVIRKTYPLNYNYRSETHQIGALTVVANLTGVYERTASRFGLILLSNGIKTFLVALFMFAVVYWFLTAPLNAITQRVRELDFSRLSRPIEVERKILGGGRDEMDLLVQSINEMQDRLHDELTAREHAEAELRDAHALLEERIKERTQSLTDEIAYRERTELELRKVSRAVEQSSNMVFITDTSGNIEYVNRQFCQLTGYERDEVIGQKPSLLKSGDMSPEVFAELWKTILDGREWRGELKDRCKDGTTFWASVSIVPVFNEEGVCTNFVAMHEDITLRKEAERAMQDARRAAEISNKAKTDLMANISHELRTPLNAIIGFSETMRTKVFGPLGNRQYEEYVEFIHSSGTHLLYLINDILDVSAVEAGKLTLREDDVDVCAVCEASIRIIRPKAVDKDIAISGIGDLSLPLLRCDPLRLKQILINLLSNAVKFTPQFGEISCEAFIDDQERFTIIVVDNGVGMDEEGIAKALAKFGQVDSSLARSEEGTGLGLPLTKGLVELHGGIMELESQPAKGTKITLRFPKERLVDKASA